MQKLGNNSPLYGAMSERASSLEEMSSGSGRKKLGADLYEDN